MSILIKGMEMPKNCCECRLLSGFECRALYKDITEFSVADECPLVPVPPHGRLIDADALYAKIPDAYPGIHKKNDMMCEITGRDIKSAPTIIPAEEGET